LNGEWQSEEHMSKRKQPSQNGADRPARDRPEDRPESDRPSEDDIARGRLGGSRGAPELEPAPMTRQRRIKTPENDTEPGHTA
jgi:hypothetical protein